MPVNIYIGLGSNLGDRAGNLLLAVRGMIDAGITITRLSHIYETEPFETSPQPTYLNMVAAALSQKSTEPEDLMQQLLSVENSLGRRRKINKGPRTIDLDLLLYGDEICNSVFLKLPHPQFHRRKFVLAPLAELAPEVVHPTLNLTVSELLAGLNDESYVKLWAPWIGS